MRPTSSHAIDARVALLQKTYAHLFGAIVAFAGLTKRDFSLLRTAIVASSFLAIGVIIVALLFELSLGLWCSVAMVGLASLSVLYYTSRVVRDYAPGQHVAASLALCSALALMFWYVLRLLMFSSSSD